MPRGEVLGLPAASRSDGERDRIKPLAIDLFCGLGGWTEGFLAEGYGVIGFDNGFCGMGILKQYLGQLVLQDVLTLHGSQFRNATCIVASPPCQAYSYRAMPWKRAKALPPPSNELFNACFRIQREACEAAGRYIPLIVENVKGGSPGLGGRSGTMAAITYGATCQRCLRIRYREKASSKAGTGGMIPLVCSASPLEALQGESPPP